MKLKQEYKNVYPTCITCNAKGKKEVCVEKLKKLANQRSSENTTKSTPDSDATPIVFVENPSNTPAESFTPKLGQAKIYFAVLSKKRRNTASENSVQEPNEELCSICGKEDPPGACRNVVWIDCDICNAWAHTICAKNHGWLNIRKSSWLCSNHQLYMIFCRTRFIVAYLSLLFLFSGKHL